MTDPADPEDPLYRCASLADWASDNMTHADSVQMLSRLEMHEASLWSAAVTACASIEGNPLGATIATVGSATCSSFQTLDYPSFNRALAVGCDRPPRGDEAAEILQFFREQNQDHFRVEVVRRPQTQVLERSLSAFDVRMGNGAMLRLFFPMTSRPSIDEDAVEIEELSPADRTAVADVQIRAWGLPKAFRAWFAASVDVPRLRYFGVRYDAKLIAVGAMHTDDSLAWLGFDAVVPEHRGHGLQRAVVRRRLAIARAEGCELVHCETTAEQGDGVNPSLRNALQTGFRCLYERSYFEPSSAA